MNGEKSVSGPVEEAEVGSITIVLREVPLLLRWTTVDLYWL